MLILFRLNINNILLLKTLLKTCTVKNRIVLLVNNNDKNKKNMETITGFKKEELKIIIFTDANKEGYCIDFFQSPSEVKEFAKRLNNDSLVFFGQIFRHLSKTSN